MVSFRVAIYFAVAAMAALHTVTAAEPPQADQFDRMLNELSASGSGYTEDAGVLSGISGTPIPAGAIPASTDTIQVTTRRILTGGSVVSSLWGRCGGDQNALCRGDTSCMVVSSKMSLCYPA
ncbi:hypothetical protein BBJ28_00014435 [Nothophytophthora sp. Chile5]|nr:hypothetical protein BBJ28_00014435 [Nothophytophthora sp. Chile5]